MGSQTVSSLSGGLGKKRREKEWTVMMRQRGSDEGESWPLIKRGFTEAQRKELEEQALINRLLSSGIPVPLNLVLPIWKSVVTSLGASYPSIHKQYPSSVGFILQGFDCRYMMDPEPGRCRRTDGKKWRCSRAVLSDQKYCEKHIHRGRQRSRKLVEASEFASPSSAKESQKQRVKPPQNANSNLSVSVGLQLMTPSSDASAGSCNTNTTSASSFSKKRVSYVPSQFIATNATTGTNSSIPTARASMTSVVTNTKARPNTSATISTVFGSTQTNLNTPKDVSKKHCGHNSSSSNNNIGFGRNVSTGLGFSPKSVLQVRGSNDSCIANRTSIELEPERCRRTDGKKWRCRRDVVPDQKYCPRHMHRGAKKLTKVFEPTPALSSTPNTARPHPTTESRTCPNTNLCISIPTSPPPISNDEKSSSSTSSDTTITDTSIGAYVINKTSS